jgi:antitoxin component of MazEF toxin-antitoxin module
MESKLIKIGNSYAIIIPDSLIEDNRLINNLEVFISDSEISIEPKKKARDGWAEQFEAAITEEHSPDEGLEDWD